ncbi:MAG: hypothetical protein NDI84_18305 [Steroidobacteraceae bacterium]|nr:hypothetical protein [Steroidobacteraceae bacterium]
MLSSSGEVSNDIADVHAAENPAPVVDTTWDPYQVWLTRVKQPRDQTARLRVLQRSTTEMPTSADSSETARLRVLSPARPG